MTINVAVWPSRRTRLIVRASRKLPRHFTPDTLLRWHRRLVGAKWNFSDRRLAGIGRPPLDAEVEQFVVRLAKENPTWGYDRITGALASALRAGRDFWLRIERQSLRSTSPQLRSGRAGGVTMFYLLFVMRLATRRIQLAGVTTSPNYPWIKQVARNLTDCEDGFLNGSRYLLLDRDTKFTAEY